MRRGSDYSRLGCLLSAVSLLVLVVLLAPGGHVSAQNGTARVTDEQATGPTIEGSSLWFIELKSPPVAEATAGSKAQQLAATQSDKSNFRQLASAAGIAFRERYSYSTLWNGLSIEIAAKDIAKVRRLPGVVAVYPVLLTDAPEPPLPEVPPDNSLELFTAIKMTGADVVQASGNSGSGIKVAVIDTGIDYNHPDLGGGFGPGFRVAGGFDLVGDAYNAGGTTPAELTPVPDPDPMDCNGHGTHVSGIIGANGLVKGVAPDVTFRMYRVFGCVGSTSSDIMLAAMEMAFADGNQVLNMSIGSAFQWPQYPTARGADNLVKKGMVVVASAGNDGTTGLYASSAPSLGAGVISVASVDNTHIFSPAFTIGASSNLIGYQPMTGSVAIPASGTTDVVDAGQACTIASVPAAVSGKIALVQRGVCSFRVKAQSVQAVGAIAAVIYNNAPGIILGSIGTSPAPAVTIPVVGISDTDGAGILTALPTTLTWTSSYTSAPNGTGKLISSFSSYGMSPDLSLKPDIAGPGGFIFSTLPLAQGGYGILSGTSMSSPHLAGAAALLLKARATLKSDQVRTVLQNNAVPGLWGGNPALGLLDNTHRQGAGLVDIPAAISAKYLVSPGKLGLGETAGLAITKRLTVSNSTETSVTFDLSHAPALATGPNTFTPSFFIAPATVAFSTGATLTVPPRGTATVDVTFTENPGLANKSLFGGYVVLAPQGGGHALRVPYSAFKGDYQSIVVLNPAASSFGNPLLRGSLSFGPNENVTIDPAHNPSGTNLAYLLLHRDHQSRTLSLEAINQVTNRSYKVFTIEYFSRNSGAGSFSVFIWDGTDINGKYVPSGLYKLRVSLLKAGGNAANPAHVESWVSPTQVTVVN